MSTLKVNGIRGTGASADAITINSTDGTCTVKATNNLSNRNLVINGAMNVAQYGTPITAEGYSCDRWAVRYTGLDNVPTTSQHALTSSDTGPWAKGFRNSLHLQNGNQTSGAGTGDYLFITYKIEAQDLANSGWDYTSASSYITLSYWVKSSVAQNFYGYFRTVDGTGQLYCWETGSLSANVWTKITKKIPGNSNITIDNNNGEGMEINIPVWWGGNWTNNNSLNTWAGFDTSNRTPDWTSTWFTTDDATFEITGVQLEVGDVATDFEHKSYDDELARCHRYYEQFNSNGLQEAVFASGYFESNGQGRYCLLYSRKRATPTITASAASTFINLNTGSVPAGDTITIKKPTETASEFQLEAGSAGTDGQSCILASKDSTEATIKISAEI